VAQSRTEERVAIESLEAIGPVREKSRKERKLPTKNERATRLVRIGNQARSHLDGRVIIEFCKGKEEICGINKRKKEKTRNF